MLLSDSSLKLGLVKDGKWQTKGTLIAIDRKSKHLAVMKMLKAKPGE